MEHPVRNAAERRCRDRRLVLPEDGGSYTRHPYDLDVDKAIFTIPDFDAICLLDDVGVTATGQAVTATRGVLECRVSELHYYCRDCGNVGASRGAVLARLDSVSSASLRAPLKEAGSAGRSRCLGRSATPGRSARPPCACRRFSMNSHIISRGGRALQ